MKIRIITLAFLLGISAGLYSQTAEVQKPSLSQRIFFGGSFGLQVGTFTNIELSPVAGVWLLPRITVAAGPSFQYLKLDHYETVIYGGRAYSQIFLIQDFDNIVPLDLHLGLFLQGEYEGLSLEKSSDDTSPVKRVYQGAFLAGLGISQPVGPRSSVEISFLWTLNDPEYQIYGEPEFRISFTF